MLILADGIGSENVGGSYQPLDINGAGWGPGSTGYCFTATAASNGYSYADSGYSFMPPPLQSIVQDYLKGADPELDPQLLTNVLGAEGVTILPFSYNGATLSGSPTDPTLTVQPADPNVPGDQIPQTEAALLDQEVWSVHNMWPNTKIIIAGHSEGGLIAETWWYYKGRFQVHNGTAADGVAAEFSLDSPINGVAGGAFCLTPGTGGLCSLGHVSSGLGAYFSSLWGNAETQDQNINNAEDGSFIPVGTDGDPLYDLGDLGKGIRSQLTFATGQNCFGFGPGSCNPAGLDFFSTCYPSRATNEHFWNDPVGGHGLVMDCPDVINYATSVFTSNASRSGVLKTGQSKVQAAAPPPAPPMGEIAPTVLSPGQTATITGQGLGTNTGSVQFNGVGNVPLAATVSGWSDTQVNVTVPAGATTGPVELITGDGVPAGVGQITILGSPDSVATISATAGPGVLDGQSTTVSVTATDANGQPVQGAEVDLSDGHSTQSATTDVNGAASFSVTAANTITYTAYSGTTFAQVSVTGLAPPAMSLTLSSSSSSGTTVQITATLDGANGNPEANQVVNFQIAGTSGPSLSSSQATTNSSGIASITVNNVGTAPFAVGAYADDSAANASVGVNQFLVAPSVSSAAVGKHVSVVGSGFTPGHKVDVYWDRTSTTPFARATINASGAFTVTIKVPKTTYGAHSIIAEDPTMGSVAYSSLTVLSGVKLKPSRGPSGKSVHIMLSGFPAFQSVALTWNSATGPSLGAVTTSGIGAATATFTVPASAKGKYIVDATASGGSTANAIFVVT